MVLNHLENLLQKVARPWNPLSSWIALEMGHSLISLTVLRLIVTLFQDTMNPKKWTYGEKNVQN